MILIAYDGSPDARAAVEHAAALMPGAETVVLSVCRAFEPALGYHGGLTGTFGPGGPLHGGLTGHFGEDGPLSHPPAELSAEEWDARLRAAALATATEGAERARAAGLEATPRVVREAAGSADVIVDVAEALDAAAIVLGSRGLSGARSWFLGSVSHGVLQHADRPVLVVPSPDVASRRAAGRRDYAASGAPAGA